MGGANRPVAAYPRAVPGFGNIMHRTTGTAERSVGRHEIRVKPPS